MLLFSVSVCLSNNSNFLPSKFLLVSTFLYHYFFDNFQPLKFTSFKANAFGCFQHFIRSAFFKAINSAVSHALQANRSNEEKAMSKREDFFLLFSI